MKFDNFGHTEVRMCDDKVCLGNAFVMFPPLACSKQLLLILNKNNIWGLPGVWGNKGTLRKYRREQGNMNLFLGSRETKLYKLEGENILIKFIKRGTNKENVWEHGNIRQFWKGKGEQAENLSGRPSILIHSEITIKLYHVSHRNADSLITSSCFT